MKAASHILALTPLLMTLPAAVTAQECVQPPSGVVSWWPAEGTAEDIVGDNHGVLQDGAGFDQGFVGSAFDLDGSQDHVLVDDDPSLNLEEFTIEGWVRIATSGDLFIATKSGSTGNFGYEMGLFRVGTGAARFTINGGIGGADITGSTIVGDGQYHHIAVTYKAPRARLYVDGVREGQEINPGVPIYEADSDFYIGARELGGIPGFWPGGIDELTFYSRALFSTEIEGIFNASVVGKCEGGIVLPWPIFEDDFELGDSSEWSSTVP
jgi:hypothetical protein